MVYFLTSAGSTVVLLSGRGITLKHQKQRQSDNHQNYEYRLEIPLDIARFAGGDEAYATLNNVAIEDLNIMVRETDASARISVI